MPAVMGGLEGAKVSYEKLQLTNGTAALPAIVVTRSGGYLNLKLASKANEIVNRVIYCIFTKNPDRQLMLNTSTIVSDAGEGNNFNFKIPDIPGDLAIYAYGIKDSSASASATFGNYKVTSASDIASLVSNRSISAKDFIFTKTNGTTIFSGAEANVTAGDNEVMVILSVGENGSASVKVGEEQAEVVNSNKTYIKAVAKGSKIEFKAMPDISWEIDAWKDNSDGSTVSTTPVYTVNSVQDAIDLTATFKKMS